MHRIELQIPTKRCEDTLYGQLVIGIPLEGQHWNRVGPMFETSSDHDEDTVHLVVVGVLTAGIRR